MKTSKKVISLLLVAVMTLTVFVAAAPALLVKTNAATTIDGVTQERVVGTDGSYATTYDNYAAMYLNGASNPTNIVIPGLNAAQDYVIQGMTYYPARDWMLVTAYHNVADGETTQSSKVFALDAATGDFVAMFSFLNVDGTVNTDHGGGVAVSENNIYYSCGDTDRKIAYAPLSALANAPVGQHTQIQLVAEKDFVEIGSVSYDSKTGYSAYVCYDEGILWVGNFYDLGAKLAGVTIAADGYNAPSNNTYNSMVFGYELNGDTSATEWSNLIGTTSTADCQGSPSYAIGLSNNIKDVQYATVDNGKLYLSRSYGSGAGNSINFGFGDSSFLTIADIDLSQPGTIPVTISTTGTDSLDKTVMAHDISNYKDYAMMPMSEGLCVVNDNIFITFEGASNKYLNENSGLTSIGNCEKPVDVIWQLDPYELMEINVAEPEQSVYYEKINNLGEIVDGEEYIIVHEADTKNPVTLNKYLYALNADGNVNDYKLSKCTTDVIKGYDAMIGHPISHYSIEKDDVLGETYLYLEEPETDDIDNIRWKISKNSNGSYSFKTTESYFANNDSLYFDGKQIGMAPSNASYLSNMGIMESGDGKGGFWLNNASTYFLWCNDGVNTAYSTKANAYYTANASAYPALAGVQETPGTFHCDALNSTGSNILGSAIASGADTYYEDGLFNIYRRVVDEVSSTYESRVYTDLQAHLQEDGTYNVVLETYAISPNHYQYREEKPTDYIIVADTSSSMASKGSTGIQSWNGSLAVSSLSVEANTSDDNGQGINGYGFSNPEEDIYIQHTDGKYYKVYMGINTTELKKVIGITTKMRQKYYAYYIADDGLYYCIQSHAINPVGRTYSEWKAWIESGENESDYSTKTGNGDRRDEDVYQGVHYRFDDVNSSYNDEHVRLDTLKTAVTDIVDDIAAQNSNNRIALIQYGADGSSGYVTTSGSVSTTDYANAFWASGTVDQLKSKISALTTSEQTNNSGIEMMYANNLIANSGVNYKTADSTRNVAVIFISDGIPGADANSSTTAAANATINYALSAKNNGAFVYTVLVGNNEVSGFNKKLYMDAVSSKYAAASSLTALGGMSVDGVNYASSLATTTMNNFINFGAITTEEVAVNTAVGLENLDANSYLRQKLSDAFKFPADFNVATDMTVELVTGEFDEIGRFTFKEDQASINANATDAAKIKNASSVDTATKTLTVTKYDYAKEYVAKGRATDGRKLRVTINGLLADETKKIRNTSINDLDTTGLYKTQTNMNNNVAFKMLPTSYFNIPEYTYVLDYGLPMYDSDVNGTLKSVSADLSAQRDSDGNLSYKTESANGLVQITNNNLDLIYETMPTNSTDSGYCLIQRDDGSYDWFEIKVVPASNVYYEEDWFTDGATGAASWSTEGTAKKEYQSLADDSTDVYGFDQGYVVASNTYSNATVAKSTVTTTAKRSTTKTFEFVGDRLDLISACGTNTGVMIVKVSGGDLTNPKAYIVDTYYDGEYLNSNNLLCQTPIVSFSGNYGNYTVEVTAAYLSGAGAVLGKAVKTASPADGKLAATTGEPVNEADAKALLQSLGFNDLADADLELVWFDDNSLLNGGTGAKGNVRTARDGSTVTSLDCYIDGLRIYNPVENNEDNYIEREQDAQYLNVIDSLNNNYIGTDTTSVDSVAYVTGTFTADVETGEVPTLSFANYENVGPQNELYLLGGRSDTQTLVLKVALPSADSKVQLGLRAVTGTASAKIGGTTFNISSPTEMYYDVTACADTTTESGVAIITIQNTGTGVLAVNNIKLTGGAAVAIVENDDLGKVAELMVAPAEEAEVVNGVVTPKTDADSDVDNGGTDTDTPAGDDSGVTGTTSFIEQLIAMLIDLIMSLFNVLPAGEVM